MIIYLGSVRAFPSAKSVLSDVLIASSCIRDDPVMLTYLHHSDPTIPHYRKEEWSWVRGAAATVDRPLLGWAGRFFLHNVRMARALVSSVGGADPSSYLI